MTQDSNHAFSVPDKVPGATQDNFCHYKHLNSLQINLPHPKVKSSESKRCGDTGNVVESGLGSHITNSRVNDPSRAMW